MDLLLYQERKEDTFVQIQISREIGRLRDQSGYVEKVLWKRLKSKKNECS